MLTWQFFSAHTNKLTQLQVDDEKKKNLFRFNQFLIEISSKKLTKPKQNKRACYQQVNELNVSDAQLF